MCAGCFDLLHPGHVRTLKWAKSKGIDVFGAQNNISLIAVINSDASVRRLKGVDRPRWPASVRREMLYSLWCVDEVFILGDTDDTPETAIELYKPRLYVKGSEYEGKQLPEECAVLRHGGRILFSPYDQTFSTTKRIAQVNEEFVP
jgi:rfaE bifunctional protein nucleotidyltransferase chain/domain